KPAQIVGIAADVHQNLENSAWPETVYEAFAQNPQESALLAVRTAGDPLRFTSAVREQVRALDRDQPIAAIRTMEDLVEDEVGQRRLILRLLESFAGVALLLALIGIYAAASYSVTQRTHEVGIRRALGAQQSDILGLVIGEGLILVLTGVALGAGGAFAATRVMKALLFHVSATDPAAFGGIALLFLLAALAASYLPARRASRIDPLAALRD
ncbi:MAG: FtsX-like permease family protein, partial [Bryobacteraceae bacterium]